MPPGTLLSSRELEDGIGYENLVAASFPTWALKLLRMIGLSIGVTEEMMSFSCS